LKLKENKAEDLVQIRDGVAICNKKGVAKEKAKYDYEVVGKKCKLELKAEVKIREGQNLNDILSIIKTSITELKEGKIFLGAMATKGFGRFQLESERVYVFEFPADGEKYLKGLQTGFEQFQPYNLDNVKPLIRKPDKDFVIEAKFNIKSSLIISSYPAEVNEPDKVHIKFNKESVIPGTSLKGAIRSRALRIINTYGVNGEEILKEPFGWANPKEPEDEKYKSRVIVEESIVRGAVESIQTRIAIDRFTGGVIKGALVETKPMWHKDEEIVIKITIKDYQPWEAGLMLLVLKDLWTSDLPIGGEKSIGRGILTGKEAKIEFDERKIFLKEEDGRVILEGGEKEELEKFVESLFEKIGG
jgi:CRISPR/Cas system CSM-associated protein Csm3 (group 7 of RAMP superfamily)